MRILLLLLVFLPSQTLAQPTSFVCVRPDVPTGLPGPTAPAPSRPFPCTEAQFDAMERERAKRQDLMARAADAHRRRAQAYAAERETPAQAARHPNPCARTEYASHILEQTNLSNSHRLYRNRVVDIVQIATQHFDPASRDMTCRATFITAGGKQLSGVLELRRNAAGEQIAIFSPTR